MSELNAFATMCAGSMLIAFLVMLIAANIGRLIRYGLSSEDEQ